MLNENRRWEGGCQQGLRRQHIKDEILTERKGSGL